MFKQEKCEKNQPERKRGRPTGKNRVPLSLEERRARNAQYERERRNETADAMLQLAQAAGCEPTTSNADILATVISQIQHAASRGQTESLDHIKRCNDNLRAQILKLQNDLRGMPQVDLSEFQELMMSESDEEQDYQPKKKKIKRDPESSWSQENSCSRKKKAKKAPKIERRSPISGAESDYSTPVDNHLVTHQNPSRRAVETIGAYPQPEGNILVNPGNSSAIDTVVTYPQPVENFVLKPENNSPIGTTSACFQPEEFLIKPEDTLAIDSTEAYQPEQEFLIIPDQTASWATTPEVEVLPVSYVPAMEEWWGYETESHWSPPDPFIGAPALLTGYQTSDSSPLLSESPSQSSESESQASSPVDLDSVLETLSDEEKMLLSGVVQQMDQSTVLGL